MKGYDYGASKGGAPSFAEASNLRQRARVAGMDPRYFYPALLSSELPVGASREVVFWKRSFVVFRGQDGVARALENRCAHRNLKLSLGSVEGCTVRCAYHGWAYDGAGCLVDMPHNDFGKKLKIRLDSLPVRERYGMIWIFPGDPSFVEQRAIPTIPEIEGPSPWAHGVIDFVWKGHFSMILDNVSDFTHGYLHRKWRPFDGDKLLDIEESPERVLLQYDTKIAAARIMDVLIDRKAHSGTSHWSCYQYPYQWSNSEDFVKHWLFLLPIDERTTRVFFLFYYRDFKLPFLPFKMPVKLMQPLVRFGHEKLVRPLFDEDGWAVDHEQRAYDAHWDAPVAEVNPQVMAYQRLTVRKWEEYLATMTTRAIGKKPPRKPEVEARDPQNEEMHDV